MRRWLQFFSERLPIPVLLLTSGGMATTAGVYSGKGVSTKETLTALLLTLLFFAVLRIMDELKDYQKDCIVHPDRPLPRGLISVDQARVAVRLLVLALSFGALPLYVWFSTASALLWLATVAYLWLMFKEFYFGHALEQSPILYAITHQVVLLLLMAALVLMHANVPLDQALIKPGLMVMGCFFTFEICRKLDPASHPMLKTYRLHYGLTKTLIFIVLTNALAAAGVYANHDSEALKLLFWGVEGSVVVGALVFAARHHKVVEGLATLSILLHLWLPWPLASFSGIWP